MTTSFETSLKMKELNFPQEGGEYYYYEIDGDYFSFHRGALITLNLVPICRAFTLGELVRMLGKEIEFEVMFLNHKHGKEVFARRKNYFTGRCSRTEKEHAPEEAAGELLAAIKEQEKLKA